MVYSDVVYVRAGKFQGSGILISPDTVLTAAHLVWQERDEKWSLGFHTAVKPRNITVTPGYDADATDSSPYGSTSALDIRYGNASSWGGNISVDNQQNDYAVIHLKQSFNVGIAQLYANYDGGSVTVSGYPERTAGAQDSSDITVSKLTGYSVLQGPAMVDESGGSGGPVWRGDQSYKQVVGLVSATSETNSYHTQISTKTFLEIIGWVQEFDKGGLSPYHDKAPYYKVATSGAATTGELTVARLYQAVFGRKPDLPGLKDWENAYAAGRKLDNIAVSFLSSVEYQGRAGDAYAQSSQDFLDNLYRNTLHRTADASGLKDWDLALSAGSYSRAEVLLAFSISPENVDNTPYLNTLTHLSNGDWIF